MSAATVGWSNTSAAFSAMPDAARIRERSSTTAMELIPMSVNDCRSSIAAGSGCPSTAATWVRTNSATSSGPSGAAGTSTAWPVRASADRAREAPSGQ